MLPDATEERGKHLWRVHSYLNEHIRFADTKAAMVIGWTSTLIGVLLAAQFQDQFGKSFVGVLSLFGFLSLLGAFACAVLVVAPRLQTARPSGFIFWKAILAHKTCEEFIKKLSSQTSERLMEQVARHVFDLADVCNSKYAWVNRSVLLASTGSIVSGLMYLLR